MPHPNNYYQNKTKLYAVTDADLDDTVNYLNTVASETRAVDKGGTGLASYTIGDLIYASGATTLSKLAIGVAGDYLKGGASPSWATLNKAAVAGLTDSDTVLFANVNVSSIITVDQIDEYTAAAGVTIDGTLIKDGDISLSSSVITNVIAELSAGVGVTVDGTLIKDGGLTASSPIISTVTTGTAPFTIASTTVVTNLNAQLHNGKTAPTGDIVGTTDTQTLSNKTLTTPTIGSFLNANHTHAASGSAGGTISHANLTTVTEDQHHNKIHDINGGDHSGTPLNVDKGGTGVATLLAYGVLLGNGTSDITSSKGGSAQLLVGQTTTPTWQTPNVAVTLTGDVTGSGNVNMNTGGDWVLSFATAVGNDSHSHTGSTLSSIPASDITAGTFDGLFTFDDALNIDGVTFSLVGGRMQMTAGIYPQTDNNDDIGRGDKRYNWYYQNPSSITTQWGQMWMDSNGKIGRESSSIRYKENLRDFDIDTSLLYQLIPKHFNFIMDENKEETFSYISEDVYELFPEIVSLNEKGEVEGYQTNKLLVIAIEEIKNLKNKIDNIKTRLDNCGCE